MFSTVNEQVNVTITVKDRDKIVSVLEGHNVWTNAGREFSCLKKVRRASGLTAMRRDYINYVGLGTGTQPELVGVNRVVDPIAYQGNNWLKEINHLRTSFVDPSSRAAVRFVAEFSGSDMLNGEDPPFISECGLFTSGHASNPDNARSVILTDADLQVPVAYHTFQPIPMSNTISLELVWELRH